jgi:hypothetical protein
MRLRHIGILSAIMRTRSAVGAVRSSIPFSRAFRKQFGQGPWDFYA